MEKWSKKINLSINLDPLNLLFCLLLFLAPFVLSGGKIFLKNPFYEHSFFANYVFFLFFAFIFKKERFKIPKSTLDLFIALFIFLNFFVSFFSPYPAKAKNVSETVLLAAIFYTISFNLDDREKREGILYIVLSAFLCAILAVFQETFDLLTYKPYTAQGLFYNPNPFGGFMAQVFPLSLIFLEDGAIFYLLSILILDGLLLSGSRGALVSFIFISLIIVARSEKKELKKFVIVVFSSFLLYLILNMLMTKPATLLQKGTNPANIFNRLAIWKDTVPMIKDYLFLGVGPFCFSYIFPHYAHPQNIYIHPHNIYLMLLLELGIFGPFLFFGIIFFALKKAMRRIRKKEIFFATLSFLSFLVQNLIECNWYAPVFISLFFFNLSIMRGEEQFISLSKIKKLLFLFAIFFTYFIFSVQPTFSRLYFEKSLSYARRGNLDEAKRYAKKGIKEFSDFPGNYLFLGEIYATENRLDQSIKYFMEGVSLYPFSERVYVRISEIYERKGDSKNTEFFLKKALFVNPNAKNVYSKLISFYVKRKDFKKAKEILQKRIERFKDCDTFLENIANLWKMRELYLKLGDYKKALYICIKIELSTKFHLKENLINYDKGMAKIYFIRAKECQKSILRMIRNEALHNSASLQ